MSDPGSNNQDNGDNRVNGDLDVDDSTLNQAFDMLAGQHRRYTIEHLRTTSGGVASVDDLADYLLAHDPDADDRDTIRSMLHHRILPKLDDTSIIDFDPRTDTVRYHGNAVIEALLDTIADNST